MTRFGGGRYTSRFDGYLRVGRTGRTDILPSGAASTVTVSPSPAPSLDFSQADNSQFVPVVF